MKREIEGNSKYNIGKTQLRKYRCRWEDKIAMDFKEIVWDGAHWIYVP